MCENPCQTYSPKTFSFFDKQEYKTQTLILIDKISFEKNNAFIVFSNTLVDLSER
jgi:hypothetical protein